MLINTKYIFFITEIIRNVLLKVVTLHREADYGVLCWWSKLTCLFSCWVPKLFCCGYQQLSSIDKSQGSIMSLVQLVLEGWVPGVFKCTDEVSLKSMFKLIYKASHSHFSMQ